MHGRTAFIEGRVHIGGIVAKSTQGKYDPLIFGQTGIRKSSNAQGTVCSTCHPNIEITIGVPGPHTTGSRIFTLLEVTSVQVTVEETRSMPLVGLPVASCCARQNRICDCPKLEANIPALTLSALVPPKSSLSLLICQFTSASVIWLGSGSRICTTTGMVTMALSLAPAWLLLRSCIFRIVCRLRFSSSTCIRAFSEGSCFNSPARCSVAPQRLGAGVCWATADTVIDNKR